MSPILRYLAAAGLIATAHPVRAQDRPLETAGEWAWNTILVEDSVRVAYVFYAEADARNQGVVLRLDNRNGVPVRYRFTALFRGVDGRERERPVRGSIAERSIVTGDAAGLFFVPFDDGSPIAEIGIRGLRVERVPPDG